MIVKMYTWPSSEDGRGPTRSTWTWENLLLGTGNFCRGAAGCFVTLPRWHVWQSRHQALMSLAMPRHTKRAEMSRRVALMGHAVNSLKNNCPVRRWHQGSRDATCHVTEEFRTLHMH